MLARFSAPVMLAGGRTVAVQPDRQIVVRIVAWLTDGLRRPGVQWPSGSANSPDPRWWHVPGAGCRWTVWALARLAPIAPKAVAAATASTPQHTSIAMIGPRLETVAARRSRIPASTVRPGAPAAPGPSPRTR
jgi:hypothetical protein